jgi:hypothetical protein
LPVSPETIACANATISASGFGNLAILKILSIKSYIPFSAQVCGGLVLYFSFTSLSILFGLLFQPLHSGLFISFYRHLHRRTQSSAGRLRIGCNTLFGSLFILLHASA